MPGARRWAETWRSRQQSAHRFRLLVERQDVSGTILRSHALNTESGDRGTLLWPTELGKRRLCLRSGGQALEWSRDRPFEGTATLEDEAAPRVEERLGAPIARLGSDRRSQDFRATTGATELPYVGTSRAGGCSLSRIQESPISTVLRREGTPRECCGIARRILRAGEPANTDIADVALQ